MLFYSTMRAIAYLFNRYPEATLTTLRREVHAVEATGLTVYRFAHRPSVQPVASGADRFEADRTRYLASGRLVALLSALIRVALQRPRKFIAALWIMLTLRPMSFSQVGYLAIACRLMDDLSAKPVDILHIHFAQNSAAVAMMVQALGGPPWTMTVHGPEDIDDRNLKGLSVRVSAANATITISDHAAEVVRGVIASPFLNVHVVRMGVDAFYLAPPAPIPPVRSLICIARFVRRKGHSILIDAVDMLRSRGIRAVVNLIGDGPLQPEVSYQVERRGLSPQVKILGWQSEKAIREYIDASTFLVLPSYAEGLPVVIMEAFARARPVIASNVGAVNELVQDGLSGLLVPPGDAGDLANAIEQLLSTETSLLFDMGLHGRRKAVEQSDATKNGKELAAIWDGILTGS